MTPGSPRKKATLAEEIKAADARRVRRPPHKRPSKIHGWPRPVVGNTNPDDTRKARGAAFVAPLHQCAGRGRCRPRRQGELSPPEECGLRPKDVFRECVNCPEMVVVQAGEVLMGSNASEIDSGLASGQRGAAASRGS